MILLDSTALESKGILIGIQKTNNNYVYLHWARRLAFKWAEYHTEIAGNYKNISGIGPTILVEWSE